MGKISIGSTILYDSDSGVDLSQLNYIIAPTEDAAFPYYTDQVTATLIITHGVSSTEGKLDAKPTRAQILNLVTLKGRFSAIWGQLMPVKITIPEEIPVLGNLNPYESIAIDDFSAWTQISDPSNPADNRVWVVADGFPAKIWWEVQVYPNGFPAGVTGEVLPDWMGYDGLTPWDGHYYLLYEVKPIAGEPYFGDSEWWEKMNDPNY